MAVNTNLNPLPGDTDNKLLQKILDRLGGGIPVSGAVTLAAEDIEIGAIEIKNATTDDRAEVKNTSPTGTEMGLVVRNIPSGNQQVVGNVADDAVDSGNPVKVGARAVDPAAIPAAVSAADRADLISDLSRRLIVY